MKQLIQSLKNGIAEVVDVPTPAPRSGQVLISTRCTLVSSGTERMLANFGKANIFDKALRQPDKFKQVLEKIQSDGLLPTLDAVRSKLDQPLELGYCNAGKVLHSDAQDFDVMDRVVSNGNHAEVVRVSKNLCAKIPNTVDDESASFTALAAIGLQGIRLAQPTIGEIFVVQGLGLVGLMTVQMLHANGCHVIGVDYNSSRCELAKKFGAKTVDLSKGENLATTAAALSKGRGVDGVLICASTKSNDVIHHAAEVCRKRARIVLVGVIGLNLQRDDFYKKEITFQVSSSYGPGRYDPIYEEQGHDYPIGFVRWTQQRNFEAVLEMMVSGALNVKPLITHRFKINDASKAYEALNDIDALGILIEYPEDSSQERIIKISSESCKSTGTPVSSSVMGCIGSGNYASRILIPAFKQAGVKLDTLASSTGMSSAFHGKKLGFKYATTDLNMIWESSQINTVVIATRHNLHAGQIISALNAGKHVFVEKPLCLTLPELEKIRSVIENINIQSTISDTEIHKSNVSDLKKGYLPNNIKPILMVGYNRRFSPHIKKIKHLLSSVSAPKSFLMTVNAGAISDDHWTQDLNYGGGRIIGEACHFIDLLRFLAACPIDKFDLNLMKSSKGDTASIFLKFSDGSIGTINYFANGSKLFPKERLEIFTSERVLQLDNFRNLIGFGWPGFSKMNLWRQDKGQNACVKAFVEAIQTTGADERELMCTSPISLNEIFEVAEVTIKLVN